MNDRKGTWDSLRAFVKEVYRIWITERPGPLAASLAYYAIFSIIPVTYIAVTVASLFVDTSALLNQLVEAIEKVIGSEGVQLIQESVASLAKSTHRGSTLTSVISFVILLFTASLIFFQLQYVLNNVWRVPPPSRDGTQAYIRNRLLAFVMVLGVGPLLILAAITSFVISLLGSIFEFERIVVLLTILTYLGLATLALALIYKYLPNAEIAWKDVWIGSLVTAIAIAIAIYLFALYLSLTRISSALQAAGTAAVFLIAFNVLAQVFVMGAVFIRVYAAMFGSKIVPVDGTSSQGKDS
jgi:membrane protein